MAPKSIQSREDILACAVLLVKSQGMENLNARSLAAELRTSTTPVLQAFSTMENLRTEVKKALLGDLERDRKALLHTYPVRPWMARMGAYALLAWRHPPAYRVLRDWFHSSDSPGSWEALLEDVGRDPDMAGQTRERVAHKAFRLNVYASGFAEMAAGGRLFRPTEEGILQDLEGALTVLMKGGLDDFVTMA